MGAGACSGASRLASPPARLVNFAFFELARPRAHRAAVAAVGGPGDANLERRQALRGRPDLIAAATPDYEIGCKRVLVTSDWYPTLLRDDVELVTGAAARVTPDGVVGADGVERHADAIVYGTGFQTHNFVAPMEVRGLDGRELNEVWGERAEAYLGTTVSGFPNMFVLYGPNTNHGSGSVPYTLESQFNYIIDAVGRLRDRGFRWIDLRPEAQEAWREEMARRSERHGVDHRRLPQLVPELARREHQQLARAMARVPPPHPADQPRRLPGRGLAAQRSSTARAAPAVSSLSQPSASGSRSIPARIASSSGPRSWALTVS